MDDGNDVVVEPEMELDIYVEELNDLGPGFVMWSKFATSTKFAIRSKFAIFSNTFFLIRYFDDICHLVKICHLVEFAIFSIFFLICFLVKFTIFKIFFNLPFGQKSLFGKNLPFFPKFAFFNLFC